MNSFSTEFQKTYAKYKDTAVYYGAIFVGVIIVCCLLIFAVVIPQIENFIAIQKEVEETEAKIAVMKNNIAYLENQNASELDLNFSIATEALPSEKDFVGLINAVARASSNAGVALDDFDFTIGKIAGNKSSDASGEVSTLATTDISFSVEGNVEEIRSFMKEIAEKLPVSEVRNASVDKDGGKVAVTFYNKSFPMITYNNEEPIEQVSAEREVLLQKLAAWRSLEETVPFSIGSSSGVVDSPF